MIPKVTYGYNASFERESINAGTIFFSQKMGGFMKQSVGWIKTNVSNKMAIGPKGDRY